MLVACSEIYAGIIADEKDVWVDNTGADDLQLSARLILSKDLGEAKIYRENISIHLFILRNRVYVFSTVDGRREGSVLVKCVSIESIYGTVLVQGVETAQFLPFVSTAIVRMLIA